MIEQICALLPQGAEVGFYRTAAGAELDLVVDWAARNAASRSSSPAPPPCPKASGRPAWMSA